MNNIHKDVTDHKENTENKDEFEEDYLVSSIGAFGKWQLSVCARVALTRFIAMWNMLSIIFLAPKTEFACVEFKDYEPTYVKNSTCYANCAKYKHYQDIFEDTLVTQFDLICGNAWLASFTQTVLMFGVLVGVSLFGWISDRFGRRKALIASGTMATIFMFCAPFSPNYWTITCIRFFIGIACGGIMALNVVYCVELVGPHYIAVAVSMSVIPDSFSETTMSVFAYFAPTWSLFLFICSVLSILIVFVSLTLPESPRWMVARNKMDEAIELMTKAAKFNRLNIEGIRENIIRNKETLEVKNTLNLKYSYLDLFKNKTLAVITILSAAVWFATGFCYFGVSQYTSQIGSNIYIVVIILGLSQIVTCPLTIVCAKYFGRKTSVLIFLVSTGSSMIVLVFVPEGTWVSTTFGVTGASAANTLFFTVNILTAELYPTSIRNMGYSFSCASCKLGAMLAPFALNMTSSWTTSIIFAVLPFLAMFICFLLPETKGLKLKDTLEH